MDNQFSHGRNIAGAGYAVQQANPPSVPLTTGTMEDRFEHLKALCNRLAILQERMTSIGNRVRTIPEDPRQHGVRPEPGDLVGRFGVALDYAGDRLIALEDLAQHLEGALFSSNQAAGCSRG